MTRGVRSMERAVRRLEAVAEWSGRAVAWLLLGVVLVTFGVVVARKLFDLGSIAVQDSILYLHALVFLLGAAYTLKHEGHVRVDIFYQKFGPRGRAAVDLFGVLCLLLPVCGFIFWSSWGYVAESWRLHEGSRDVGGLPGVFLLKSAILVMPALLAVQGLAQALRAALVLRGHPEETPPPADGEPEV